MIPPGRGAAGVVLFALLVIASLDGHAASTNKDVWAEKWCELNDCYGIRAAEQRQGAVAKVEKEHRKATRRYRTTGEVKAINSEHVAVAYFGYDGPTLDHPAFPGVAAEHAERAERAHEENALGIRKVVQQRTISPPQPGGGFLLPSSDEAGQLAVRALDDSTIGMARRRHSAMKEQLRMDCMYGYDQEGDGHGGFTYGGGRTTVPKAPKGCAAGSVWQDDGRGHVVLTSRTAESMGSVWRKVNGTDREWWEDIAPPPKNTPWVQSWKQWRSQQLKPYKRGAPPPCSPGYGGAFCKIELGTGGDYVDEEDEPPPWANMADVKRLKQFWREQHALATGQPLPGVDLKKHRDHSALPLATGEYSAGTAERDKGDKHDCACDPLDFTCIQKCTDKAMIAPKRCYEKCDNTMCHQECVHVEVSFDEPRAKGVGSTPSKSQGASDDKPATHSLGAGEASMRQAISGSGDASSASGAGNAKTGEEKGAAGVNLCEPGAFSITGQEPCELCAEGSYMPQPGARSCARCPQGTFQNATGATACDSCDDGTDSATTKGAGATSSKDCGSFPAVTGIQYLKYEQQADEQTILDGHTAVGDDNEWKLTKFGGALGPWFGGWWIAVYGKNLGKSQKDLYDVRVGDLACRKSVWLSASSSACMVPRGMGWGLPVTVELVGGQQASVPNKFSYEAPVVDSYHPRNGPPRGGFWVTISGRNFGYLDTSPVASVGGRICLETYWMSNTQIVCRGAPGVGGPSMLHHVDITFEPAEHVQEMPRRLRSWVRSVLQRSAHSVSAKQNASKPLVEIDLKTANDPASSALVPKDDKAGKASGARSSKAKKPSTATSLVEMKQEWEEREREVKAELSELHESATDVELGLLATYLERVEERDKEREEDEAAERQRKLAEYKAVLEAERKIREEEEAAAKARQEQEELRKTLTKGTVEKKLDKFQKARDAARKKKLAGDAKMSLDAAKGCTDLVTLDCKAGNCKLRTAPALASPLCIRAELEKAANMTEAAGMGEAEAAKKVVALLFEMRVGLEKGDKSLKTAEAAMAKAAGRQDEAATDAVKAATAALAEARAAYQSVGVSGETGLAAVGVLEGKAEEVLAAVARNEEAERKKHETEAVAAVAKARAFLAELKLSEARASHGNAMVEYQLAGLAESAAGGMAALLEEIAAAEQVAKARDEEAAVRKRAELEAEEKKKAAEAERRREEAAAAKAKEEEERLRVLAEKERKEEEAEAKRKKAEEERKRRQEEEDSRQRAAAAAKQQQLDAEARKRAEADSAAAAAAAAVGEGGAAGAGAAGPSSSPGSNSSSEVCSPSSGGAVCASANASVQSATAAGKAAAESKVVARGETRGSGGAASPEKKVGVGMGVKPVLGADKVQTGLTVSKLVPGGPAEESKQVEEGDLLESVDGVDVRSWPLKKLATEVMLGTAGSQVQLTLRSKASGELKAVVLVRR